MSSVAPYYVDYHSNQDLSQVGDDVPFYYFAYGSNMDPQQMKERALTGAYTLWPNDADLTVTATPLGVAVLKDYALNFNKINTRVPGAHFASVSPESNSIVEGALYQLDKKFIEILDYFEGVETGHYTRELVTVALKTQNKADRLFPAIVYIAHPEKSIEKGEKGTPTEKYLETIVRGALKFDLSIETIEKLMSWKTFEAASSAVQNNSKDHE